MGTRVGPSSRGRKLNESGFALVSSGYVQGNGHVRGMEGDWRWNWTSISIRTKTQTTFVKEEPIKTRTDKRLTRSAKGDSTYQDVDIWMGEKDLKVCRHSASPSESIESSSNPYLSAGSGWRYVMEQDWIAKCDALELERTYTNVAQWAGLRPAARELPGD